MGDIEANGMQSRFIWQRRLTKSTIAEPELTGIYPKVGTNNCPQYSTADDEPGAVLGAHEPVCPLALVRVQVLLQVVRIRKRCMQRRSSDMDLRPRAVTGKDCS